MKRIVKYSRLPIITFSILFKFNMRTKFPKEKREK